ncbi:MAG TPA: translation initiation factor IF-2 [Candidatus Saccharimonadales bacterium]|nr:translation initiation factor IF-2 [Candidatus Saccharimonadales bacterium]
MSSESKKIEITDMITVGALAEKLDMPVSNLIAELMKNGVMATINEQLDFDTAQIIVSEINPEIELAKAKTEQISSRRAKQKKTKSKGTLRPPVVAVMGHVDHGKTSLLDAIRGAQTVKQEAGGITQHISAYQVVHKKRQITLLDTPGHEAFAALREHGAELTDVAVIVVAADDGVKPQTIEAIRFAKKANAKIVVAINKIDKEGANVNMIKQQLAEQKVMVEGYGGDTVCVEVSAKTGQGVEQLLDMILLVADVEELKADYEAAASGLVIESHMEQGRGPVAIVLVDEGTLKVGDYIVTGSVFGKVRSLSSTDGKPLKEATPAMPVVISGFKSLPEFGHEFSVSENEKSAKDQAVNTAESRQGQAGKNNLSGSELIHIINRRNELSELNLIIKADVQGSLTSVSDSLKALGSQEVAVRILSAAVGAINESDIHLAHTSKAIIYAFNVVIPPGIKRLANRDKVSIRQYRVIYELIDDVKAELNKLLKPEVVETPLGRLIVRGVFNTTASEVICGGEVTKGTLKAPALAKLMRDGEELAEVEVTNLKSGPQDTKEVPEGEMCGVSLATKTKLEVKEGDHLEVFTRETHERSI